MSFGAGAVRLSTLASRFLGWRPAEFWQATPAELAAALAPLEGDAPPTLSRTDLNRMMEKDHGR